MVESGIDFLKGHSARHAFQDERHRQPGPANRQFAAEQRRIGHDPTVIFVGLGFPRSDVFILVEGERATVVPPLEDQCQVGGCTYLGCSIAAAVRFSQPHATSIGMLASFLPPARISRVWGPAAISSGKWKLNS